MTTSNDGNYTVTQLPVGSYVVIVTVQGFQTTTLENIKVTRGQNERGPWFLNENISIARTFGSQRRRLEFRFEVFNLLNRTIWGNPDSTITSANFGRVTTLNNAPRQMQLGLRFEF